MGRLHPPCIQIGCSYDVNQKEGTAEKNKSANEPTEPGIEEKVK